MPHSGKLHQDKSYMHRESPRYFDERSRQAKSSDGRLSRGIPERSRTSSAFADPEQSHHGYSDFSPYSYPPKKSFSEKCSNLCSRRGVLKFIEVTVNILVLVCIGASQAGVSGFSSLGGFGSFNINSMYSPFEGTELREVTDLDMQFSQMRAPCVYGGVAFSLTMMCLTLLFLIGGGKPIHRLSLGLLVTECLFDILACLGYIAAVGLYLHFVMQINATDICKRRERLYARRGYTSMNCSVQGGDASVALFGLLAACLYLGSFVVCLLTFRSVRAFRRQENKVHCNLDRTYKEESHPDVHSSHKSALSTRTLATLV